MKRIIIAAILTGAFSTLLMSQTTAWARNPENPIPPRQGIVLT